MLSAMAKQFFSQSPVLLFPVLGLVLFLLVFTFVTWRAMRMESSEIEPLAQLPLDSDHLAPPRRAS